MRICKINGCDLKHQALGLCDKHYRRLRHHGDTSTQPPAIDQFWLKMDQSGGPDSCWVWQQSKDSGGYGMAWDGEKRWKAHRLSWNLAKGPIPDGMDVLHRCDNPPCCNPGHLWLGKDRDNILDCIAKGRYNRQCGESHVDSKITEQQAREILLIWQQPNRPPQREIAEKYGISQPTVSQIVRRTTWKHLTSL